MRIVDNSLKTWCKREWLIIQAPVLESMSFIDLLSVMFRGVCAALRIPLQQCRVDGCIVTDLIAAPVQPWDALICTSVAVKNSAEYLRQAHVDYLKARLGISKIVLPQLPVVVSGENGYKDIVCECADGFRIPALMSGKWFGSGASLVPCA